MKKNLTLLLFLTCHLAFGQTAKNTDSNERSWINFIQTNDGNLFISEKSFKKDNEQLSVDARFVPSPPDDKIIYYTLYIKEQSCKDGNGQMLMKDPQGNGESIIDFDFSIKPTNEDDSMVIKVAKLLCQYNIK